MQDKSSHVIAGNLQGADNISPFNSSVEGKGIDNTHNSSVTRCFSERNTGN